MEKYICYVEQMGEKVLKGTFTWFCWPNLENSKFKYWIEVNTSLLNKNIQNAPKCSKFPKDL